MSKEMHVLSGMELHNVQFALLSVTPIVGLTGTVKWVSAFGLSNNDKRRWWMWMVSAYRRTRGLWFGLRVRPSGARAAFIERTRWTLAVASVHDWRHHKHAYSYY